MRTFAVVMLAVLVSACAPTVVVPEPEPGCAGSGGSAGAGGGAGGDGCVSATVDCNKSAGETAAFCIDQVTGGPLCKAVDCAPVGWSCEIFSIGACCKP